MNHPTKLPDSYGKEKKSMAETAKIKLYFH